MSDILIRGMKMPRSCADCDLTWVDDEYNLVCCVTDTVVLGTIGEQDNRNCTDHNCPLVEVHEEYGDLIDKAKLYEKVAEWETQALQHASKLLEANNVEEWRRWTSILNERTAFKHDVADAPVVIEGNL